MAEILQTDSVCQTRVHRHCAFAWVVRGRRVGRVGCEKDEKDSSVEM